MLIGQYIQKLSKRGQTALPSRFKKEVGEKVILSRWYEGSLSVFSYEMWEKIVQQATLGLSTTAPARETERFLLGAAFEIELDNQGRFVIPQALRTFGKFAEEVMFVGLGNRIEIWDKKLWEEKEREVSQNAEKLLEKTQGGWNEN